MVPHGRVSRLSTPGAPISLLLLGLRMTVASLPLAEQRNWATPLFAGTMFASAALVFMVEPLIAKMILPQLGGSPAVWNTCMAFFQTALLAGYLYAHLL
jgi:hypothetical protein